MQHNLTDTSSAGNIISWSNFVFCSPRNSGGLSSDLRNFYRVTLDVLGIPYSIITLQYDY